MSRYVYDDYDYEEDERQQRLEKIRCYKTMSPEELGREWEYQCRRHDSAVDRCEEMNSPTIEESQGWMNWIEREFKARGLNQYDYILNDA